MIMEVVGHLPKGENGGNSSGGGDDGDGGGGDDLPPPSGPRDSHDTMEVKRDRWVYVVQGTAWTPRVQLGQDGRDGQDGTNTTDAQRNNKCPRSSTCSIRYNWFRKFL